MISTSATPGYQNYAPQAAYQPAAPTQAQLEKMKLAAVAVINSYADAIAKGMQKMFTDEFAICSNMQATSNELSEITLTKSDSTVIKFSIRPRKLQADFADSKVEMKISTFDRADRFIFSAILQKTEELLTPISKEILKSVQAVVDKTLGNHALVAAMPVTQSLIFKSQVYACVAKMPVQHKAIILNLTK